LGEGSADGQRVRVNQSLRGIEAVELRRPVLRSREVFSRRGDLATGLNHATKVAGIETAL
jgi:hypothetical protein